MSNHKDLAVWQKSINIAKIIVLVILISSSQIVAKQAGNEIAFLQSGLGARPIAIGGAFCAVANDANSPYWNPAGMLFAKNLELTSMQSKLASELDIFYLSGVKKDNDSAWGVYWVNGNMPEIPIVTQNETTVSVNTDIKPDDYTNYQAHALGLAYAQWLIPNIAIGLNLTAFYKDFNKLEYGKGAGVTATPGLLWLIDHNLSLGAVIRDLLNYQRWDTGTSEWVHPELSLGLSYIPIDNLLLSGELRQKFDSRYSTTSHIGLEWTLAHFFNLRGGLNQEAFTAGCGITTDKISMDYAYTGELESGLGDSYRVSLGIILD